MKISEPELHQKHTSPLFLIPNLPLVYGLGRGDLRESQSSIRRSKQKVFSRVT